MVLYAYKEEIVLSDLEKYLTKIELEEVQHFLQKTSDIDRFLGKDLKEIRKLLRIERTQLKTQLTPYIRLALERQKKPPILKYKNTILYLLFRLWSSFFGLVLLIASLFVVGLIFVVVSK
jgi:hypothetical protein